MVSCFFLMSSVSGVCIHCDVVSVLHPRVTPALRHSEVVMSARGPWPVNCPGMKLTAEVSPADNRNQTPPTLDFGKADFNGPGTFPTVARRGILTKPVRAA